MGYLKKGHTMDQTGTVILCQTKDSEKYAYTKKCSLGSKEDNW